MVQSPFYPEDGACHVYVLHPPGGLVGGDHLEIEIEAGHDTQTLVTTPAATKFYRSNGRQAVAQQTIRVDAGATFEWVPQESLVFNGADAASETRIKLDRGSRLLAWESLCLARPANAEPFSRGRLLQRLEVWVDDKPQLIERLELHDSSDPMHAPWGQAGYAAWATALAYPADPSMLDLVRTLGHEFEPALGRVGATLIEGLLVLRGQAHQTRELTSWLHRIWRELRPRVLNLAPEPPRIWAT